LELVFVINIIGDQNVQIIKIVQFVEMLMMDLLEQELVFVLLDIGEVIVQMDQLIVKMEQHLNVQMELVLVNLDFMEQLVEVLVLVEMVNVMMVLQELENVLVLLDFIPLLVELQIVLNNVLVELEFVMMEIMELVFVLVKKDIMEVIVVEFVLVLLLFIPHLKSKSFDVMMDLLDQELVFDFIQVHLSLQPFFGLIVLCFSLLFL